MATKDSVTHVESSHDDHHHKTHTDAHIVPIEQEVTEDARHIDLSWRSWVVVFVCCFAYEIVPFAPNRSNVDIESCLKCLLS
jgi:hypothetical protein